jgi:hypothetical protein
MDSINIIDAIDTIDDIDALYLDMPGPNHLDTLMELI